MDITLYKKNLGVLWFFLKAYRLRMFGVLCVMLVSGALEALNLAVLYPILNYGLDLPAAQTGPLSFLVNIIRTLPYENKFLAACVLLIIITVFSTLVKLFYHYCSNKLVKVIIADNQHSIFQKYLSADYGYFIEQQQGKMIYVGTVASLGISNSLLFIVRVCNTAVTCFFFLVVLWVLSWQATVLMMAVGAAYIFLIKKLATGLVNRSAVLVVESDKQKNIILNEFITGVRSIKTFLTESFWNQKYKNAVKQSVDNHFKVMMGKIMPDALIKFTFFMLVAVLGIILSMRSSGDITAYIPLLGTFAAVASRLFPYVNLLGNDMVGLARNFPDTKVVYDTLNESNQMFEDGVRECEAFKESIVFEHVDFRHKAGSADVLNDVSFTIRNKGVTAIVGPSGSGKTTIINLLLRFYRPTKGRVLLDGQNITDFRSDSYLNKIGFVGQEIFIFNGTIKENIVFGRDCHFTDEQVREAAFLANADEFISELSDGYDTHVGESGARLSAGQRQRIALARAVLTQPEILILDEATSALDNISEKKIQEAVTRISKDTTVVVVAHRLTTVKDADVIVVLEKGCVMEQGTHQDLINKKNVYFDLYN